ncbi:MAG: hypothetical protein Tsb0014_20710 [Pleurocapsa sp.]
MNQPATNCQVYNLSYRGVPYIKKITSIKSQSTNTEIKYRGATYSKSSELSVLKPESLFYYRGIKYVRSLQLLCL